MARLAILTITLAVAAATVSGSACFDKCRFRFCDYKTKFLVGKRPDVAFTGPICSKYGKRIGHVDSTGEAYVFRYGKFIPISEWHPDGLKQKFTPSFFKSFGIYKRRGKYSSYKRKGKYADLSGIGHETPQQNQIRFLNKKCFVVPLTAYQVLDKKGNVVKNVHPRGKPYRDCVAFKTYTKYA